jgi:hypothetical protein
MALSCLCLDKLNEQLNGAFLAELPERGVAMPRQGIACEGNRSVGTVGFESVPLDYSWSVQAGM